MNPNIVARLFERATTSPERLAIASTAERVSYAGLAASVEAFGRTLRGAGIGRGDRVLLLVPLSVRLYVALLGTLHAGAVAVFVDAWADRRRRGAAVAAAAPRALVGGPAVRLLRWFERPLRRIPRVLGLPSVAGDFSFDPAGVDAVDAAAPALVTFTTGSTGRPKASVRSHGFLWAQHEALSAHLEARPSDIDMPTLPIFVLNNLAGGIPTVLPEFDPRRPGAIDPQVIVGQMRRERVTTASGSPVFFDRLLGAKLDLPLRTLFTGGAPVLPPLARRLAALSRCEARVVYGSTEAEPIAGARAREIVEAIESEGTRGGLLAGRPANGIEVRIVKAHEGPISLDDAGWTDWEAAEGEIVVAGRHVLSGYLADPDSDREAKIRDGSRVWHRTGDGGRIDATGRLWLLGRIGRRVVREGAAWWPLPAEMAAMEEPGIAHAAYLGVPRAGEEARAVLCVETGSGAFTAERERSLRSRVAPWPVDAVVPLERIPRDPRHASKTDSEALLALRAMRRLARPASPPIRRRPLAPPDR